MEPIQTIVHFVSGGSVQPEYINGATGDSITTTAIVAAIVCAAIAILIASICRIGQTANDGIAASIAKKSKITKLGIAAFSIAAAVLLAFGVATNVASANTTSPAAATASETITATVDETTGSVTFEDGWIKATEGQTAVFEGMNVQYAEGIALSDVCTWQVKIDGQTVYDDEVDKPSTKSIEFTDATLSLGVTNLSAETAKALIDKDVLNLSFYVITKTQEEAEEEIIEIADEFIELITDEIPSTELFEEDKAELLEKMAAAKAEAEAKLAATTDPAEIQKILDEYNAEIENLKNEAAQKQAEIVAEKETFTSEQKENIADTQEDIANDGWLSDSSKAQYNARLNDILNNTLPQVNDATTREDMENAMGQTVAGVDDIKAKSEAESAAAEKAAKETAQAEGEKQYDSTDEQIKQFPEESLLKEDREKVQKQLDDAWDKYQEDVKNASSQEELDAIRKAFEEENNEILEEAQKASEEAKAEKEQIIVSETENIEKKVEETESDAWLSEEDKKDFEDEYKAIDELLKKIENATSHEEIENLQAEINKKFEEIDAAKKEASEEAEKQVKKDAEEWAKSQEVEDVIVIQNIPNLWNEDKDKFSEDIAGAYEDLLEAIENAKSKEEVEQAKQAYNDTVDKIKKQAKDEAEKAAAEKKAAIDTLNTEEKTLETAAENKALYGDSKESFKEDLENISKNIEDLNDETSKTEFDKQQQEIENSLAAQKAAIEDQIKKDEASKAALNKELDDKLAAAEKALDDLGEKMSADQKAKYEKQIQDLIDAQKTVIENAKNEKEASDKNKEVLDDIDDIIKAAQDQVAEWNVEWDPPTKIEIDFNGSYTLPAPVLNDERYKEEMGYIGPVYSIVSPPKGFTIAKVDGKPQIKIKEVDGGTYTIHVKSTYSGVTDAGCKTDIEKEIEVLVANKPTAKAVYDPVTDTSNPTFTFYYDNETHEGDGIDVYNVKNSLFNYEKIEDSIFPDWYSLSSGSKVAAATKLVIDESFQYFTSYTDEENGDKVDFTSIDLWFAGMNKLTSVEGLGYITNQVISIDALFWKSGNHDSPGETLDLTELQTQNITEAEDVFLNCVFKNLILPDKFCKSLINKENPDNKGTKPSTMFFGSLFSNIKFVGTALNSLTNYAELFASNGKLENLDVSKWQDLGDTTLESVEKMFATCTSLKRIYVNEGWDFSGVASSNNMFNSCNKLLGGNGTKFDSTKIDSSYARIDKAAKNDEDLQPGYFTYAGNDLSRLTYDLNLETETNGNEQYKDYFQQVPKGDYFTVQGENTLPKPVNLDTSKYFTGWKVKNGNDAIYWGGNKLLANASTIVLEAQWSTTEPTAKAVFNSEDKSFKFYYDTEDHTGDNLTPYSVVYTNINQGDHPSWTNEGWEPLDEYSEIEFCDSFAGFTNYDSNDQAHQGQDFCSMDGWFCNQNNLKSVKGFNNIKGKITSIDHMFSTTCQEVGEETTLDLTGFPDKYISVAPNQPFGNCWFTNIIIPNNFMPSLKTQSLSQYSGFFTASGVSYIKFKGDAFGPATDLEAMFASCLKLKSVDMSNFHLPSKVDKTDRMFFGCSSLTTIYVNESWNTTSFNSSENMFQMCDVLTGQKGTTVQGVISGLGKEQAVAVSGTYAVVDDGLLAQSPKHPGYLTLGPAGEKKGKAVCYQDTISNGETFDNLMEFVYDDHDYEQGQVVYGKGTVSAVYPVTYTEYTGRRNTDIFPQWINVTNTDEVALFNPQHINFANSFKDFTTYDENSNEMEGKPFTSLDFFFASMCQKEESINYSERPPWISGWENLAPNQITTMRGTFQKSFTELIDEHSYPYENNFIIDLTSFGQNNLISLNDMLSCCGVSKVKVDANFGSSITSYAVPDKPKISASPFYHSWVKEINFYHAYDKDGTERKFGYQLQNATGLFSECCYLQSVDLNSLDLSKTTSYAYMFKRCQALETIDVSMLDSSNVVDMSSMFAITTVSKIDLSNFDTRKVKYMGSMFSQANVEKIYVGEDWSTSLVKGSDGDNGEQMFWNALYVTGECGTTWEDVKEKIGGDEAAKLASTATYAVVDEGIDSDSPGYLSVNKTGKAVHDKTNHTFKFYYDGQSHKGDNIEVYPITWTHLTGEESGDILPLWVLPSRKTEVKDVTYVEFDESFADFTKYDFGEEAGEDFSSIDGWFINMEKLTDIKGLEYVLDKVTSANYAFLYCPQLKNIYYHEDFPDTLVDKNNIFYMCISLKGGNGTKYDGYKDSADMTKIDRGGYFDNNDVSGYLTYSGQDACKLTYDLGEAGPQIDSPYNNYFQQVKQGDYFTVQGADAIKNPMWGKADTKYFAGWRVKASNDSAPYFAGSKLQAQGSEMTLVAMWSDTPLTGKAVYDDNDKSFTFYYDNDSHETDHTTVFDIIYDKYSEGSVPLWQNEGLIKESATTVVFDKSFAGFIKYDSQKDPEHLGKDFTSMDWWLYDFDYVTSVTGFENIKGPITSIAKLFEGAGSLTDIDQGEVLDLSGFPSKHLKSYNELTFANCKFDTLRIPDGFAPNLLSQVGEEGMGIFCNMKCNHIIFEGKAFEKITDYSSMFKDAIMETIDFSNYQATTEIECTSNMFLNCTSLTTIFVNELWDLSGVTPVKEKSEYMFTNCPELTGGQGTTYNGAIEKGIENWVAESAIFAVVDQGLDSEKPGYLTLKSNEKKAKAVYDKTDLTFTFYYDNDPHTSENTTVFPVTYTHAGEGTSDSILPSWFQWASSTENYAEQIIFDDSFAQFTNYADDDPTEEMQGKMFTSLDLWFAKFSYIEGFVGFENISRNITSINKTFINLGINSRGSSDTTLDLTGFPTKNIESVIPESFKNCSFDKVIIPDGFMSNLRSQHNNQYGLFSSMGFYDMIFEGTAFNSLTDYSYMFNLVGCQNTIDLCHFQETSNIEKTYKMFNECIVKKIYVNEKWDLTNVTAENSADMFKDCDKLTGQNGTTIKNAAKAPRAEHTRQEHLLDSYMAKVDLWNEQAPADDTAGYLSLGPDPSQKRAKAICYSDGINDTLMEFVYDDVEYQEGAWYPDKNAYIKYVFPVTYTSVFDDGIFPQWFNCESVLSPKVNPLHINITPGFKDFTNYADEDPYKPGQPFTSLDGFFALMNPDASKITEKEWVTGLENLHEDCITSMVFTFNKVFYSKTEDTPLDNDVYIDLCDLKQANLEYVCGAFQNSGINKLIVPGDFAPKITSGLSGGSPNSIFNQFWGNEIQNVPVVKDGTTIKFGHYFQDAKQMFNDCRFLKNIDFENIELNHIKDFEDAFFNCISIEEFDLSIYSFVDLENVRGMFNACSNLKHIYSSTDWTFAQDAHSEGAFNYCPNLVGGNGTKYDQEKTDGTMAKIDKAGQTSAGDVSGYFTYKGSDACKLTYDLQIPESINEGGNEDYEGYFQQVKQGQYFTVQGADALPEPKWPEGTEPTMYFEGWKINGEGDVYWSPAHVQVEPGTTDITLKAQWSDTKQEGKAVYDKENKSFTFYYDSTNHADSTHDQYHILKTEYNPDDEIYVCPEWFDMSGEGSKVKEATSIKFDSSFAGFKKYDYGEEAGEDFESMALWFMQMLNVEETSGWEYITTGIKDLSGTFSFCGNLEHKSTLDLTKFDCSKVSKADSTFNYTMFENLIVPDKFGNEVTSAKYQNFTYKPFNCVDCVNVKFNGEAFKKLTNWDSMFSIIQNSNRVETKLSTIDFCNLQSIININNFDNAFCNCNNLKTIYVNNNWQINADANTTDMFYNCTSLVGGNGTKFNSNKTDGTMAKIDYATKDNFSSGYLTYKGVDACKLSYDLNGVTITDSPFNTLTQTVQAGKYFTVQGDYFENPLDPSGEKFFDGWKIQGKESAGIYHAGQTILATAEPIVLVAQWSDQPKTGKAVYDNETGFLTFYYDSNTYSSNSLTQYSIKHTDFNTMTFPLWQEKYISCTKIVFDESFKGFTQYDYDGDAENFGKPFTSMDMWFYGFGLADSIDGMENISPTVETINGIFYGLGSSSESAHENTLDLTGLPTARIVESTVVFANVKFKNLILPDNFCPNLVKQNIVIIEDERGFFDCNEIENIIFKGTAFKSLNDFSYMFFGGEQKTIDFSNLQPTNHITEVNYMFADCEYMTTVYVNKNWTVENASENWTDMFRNCSALKGCKETTLQAIAEAGLPDEWTGLYARIDEGISTGGKPGYFWGPVEKSAKAVCYQVADSNGDPVDSLMEFVYDSNEYEIGTSIAEKGTISQVFPVTYTYCGDSDHDAIYPAWYDIESVVIKFSPKHINFAESFKGFTTYDEYSGSMAGQAFTSLDVFFPFFSNLESIDGQSCITGWENIAPTITTFRKAFEYDFVNTETAEPISNTAVIDLTKFNQPNLIKHDGLFDCCFINKIIFPGNFAPLVTSYQYKPGVTEVYSKSPFLYCYAKEIEFIESTVDGQTIKYGHSLTDASGMFEFCPLLEKINVEGLDLSNVKDVTGMFLHCEALKKIDLSCHNFSNVEIASDMFSTCISLQEIDLSSFDTQKLKYTDEMFKECEKLEKIYVGDGWDMTNVEYSYFMFQACNELAGEKESSIANCQDGLRSSYVDSEHLLDVYMAHVDAWNPDAPAMGQPGYLSTRC